MQPTNDSQVHLAKRTVPSFSRLNDVLVGFPEGLTTKQSFREIVGYVRAIDSLGRLDKLTGQPIIDEHTLRALLLDFVDVPLVKRFVYLLGDLPGCRFRSTRQPEAAVVEAPFFGLAEKVAIFDSSPATSFRDLAISSESRVGDIIAAVQRHFPSLEEEFLEPDGIPVRMERVISEDDQIEVVIRAIFRQLGWWAAFVTVLLVPITAMVRREMVDEEDTNLLANVWPLSIYLLAAAVGGWTLTVVGSLILAPIDRKEHRVER